MTAEPERLRITRIIARLNIGGPAIQAITLTQLLEQHGYSTRLVRGVEAPSEGSMDHLAESLGVHPTLVGSLRRDPGFGDLIALVRLVVILRRDRPHIVHTHAAKAGTLGRLAAVIAFPRRRRRPVLVHTFHGHSLTGYFSSRTAAFYRRVEQVLARVTDRLLAVSPEVRDELVELGVAPYDRFEVVPLGFDLSPFTDDSDRVARRTALRAEWDVPQAAPLVTLIARLVPIKRVDRFLRVARAVAAIRPDARFAIVGDGELREKLLHSEDARALEGRLVWAGFRRDIADICFASDVVMLTSDNEGTPVSLIEAQACGVPVIGTDVGGVRSAVADGQSGFVVDASDEPALIASLERILGDGALAEQMRHNGRYHSLRLFSVTRLVSDLDNLYRCLVVSTGRPRRGLGRDGPSGVAGSGQPTEGHAMNANRLGSKGGS